MGQALYRKYRSRKFSEVIGQDHITKTLQNALTHGRISHAYLFSGPKGVGKTSVARILAHEVNSFTYSDNVHLDIIEIDAASNRRIDEIRDLREKVHITPTSGSYKVYIIDEVHMLTKEAFNALLKTLEEPPKHCIFILATTEPHKLPETIISRTQQFNFKPVEASKAAQHLANIAKKEKIDIDKQALDLLAVYGEGSFRDSISLLDQLSSAGKPITSEVVREALGMPRLQVLAKIIAALKNGDPQLILKTLDELKQQGTNPVITAKEIAKSLRAELLATAGSRWFSEILKSLLEVSASSNPQEMLEIILLEFSSKNSPVGTSNAPEVQINTMIKAPSEVKEPVKQGSVSNNFDISKWPEFLNRIKIEAPSLYTALRLAEPRFNDNKLTLVFRFGLHQKKVAAAKSLAMVSTALKEVMGSDFRLECVVDKSSGSQSNPEAGPPAKPPGDAPSGHFRTISNIFGQVEVLES